MKSSYPVTIVWQSIKMAYIPYPKTLSIYLSVYLSIYLSIYLRVSIYLSIYLSVCLSIYICQSTYCLHINSIYLVFIFICQRNKIDCITDIILKGILSCIFVFCCLLLLFFFFFFFFFFCTLKRIINAKFSLWHIKTYRSIFQPPAA